MRETGNAMWCVHKHLSSGGVHAYETSQKVEREGNNVSMATRQEANEMFSDMVAAEKHIVKEIIPKLIDKGEKEKAYKLSKLADEIRDARQGMAQTNVFFLNDKMKIEGDLREELGLISSRLDRLLVNADEFAPMMEQEQILCNRCAEDATSLATTFVDMVRPTTTVIEPTEVIMSEETIYVEPVKQERGPLTKIARDITDESIPYGGMIYDVSLKALEKMEDILPPRLGQVVVGQTGPMVIKGAEEKIGLIESDKPHVLNPEQGKKVSKLIDDAYDPESLSVSLDNPEEFIKDAIQTLISIVKDLDPKEIIAALKPQSPLMLEGEQLIGGE